MADWFTADGGLDPTAFASWQDLEAFKDAEIAFWTGLESEGLSAGAHAAVQKTKDAWGSTRRSFVNLRNQGHGHHGGTNLISLMLQKGGGALPSSVVRGEIFKTVEQSASLSAALFNVAFRMGVLSLADAKDPDDLVGGMWDVAPGLADTLRLSEALQAEREKSKDTVKALKATVAAAEKTRERNFSLLVGAAKETGKRWAVRRNLRMRSQIREWRLKHEASEVSIKAVEDTYKEHMGLKAPVEYWKNKASAHGKSERLLRWLVVVFFVVAIIAIVTAFWGVGWTLINLSLDPKAKPLPPGVYVVASAGLGSAAAVLFWGGRLLTKLYLSQHHLRQDAEERATMTETYLALIENQAAGTEDRQVILNALFRATPDGIVKEEGGLDPSIAAALGKYLAK